jgi:hypothetical protein
MISNNLLSGTIPSSVLDLDNLIHIDMRFVDFSHSQITILILFSRNLLSGTVPFQMQDEPYILGPSLHHTHQQLAEAQRWAQQSPNKKITNPNLVFVGYMWTQLTKAPNHHSNFGVAGAYMIH